jgi:hypothetical protein
VRIKRLEMMANKASVDDVSKKTTENGMMLTN